jgi:hypothetical protein
VAYNFRTGKNKINLHKEYDSVSQKVLFGKAVHAELTSGRKYVTLSHSVSGFALLFQVGKLQATQTPTKIRITLYNQSKYYREE